jgi:hypothetical protein
MEFVKFILSRGERYDYNGGSNLKMDILGCFLAYDVGCGYPSSLKEWGINDSWGEATNGNITMLEKTGNYILLSDLFSEEEVPTVLKMTREQYVQVITDWEEKGCKLKPKEVIIKHENDQFIIETTN